MALDWDGRFRTRLFMFVRGSGEGTRLNGSRGTILVQFYQQFGHTPEQAIVAVNRCAAAWFVLSAPAGAWIAAVARTRG